MSLTDRVRLLMHPRPEPGERHAVMSLGYGTRADHPWAKQRLNEARPQTVATGGRADEQEFEGAGNSID